MNIRFARAATLTETAAAATESNSASPIQAIPVRVAVDKIGATLYTMSTTTALFSSLAMVCLTGHEQTPL